MRIFNGTLKFQTRSLMGDISGRKIHMEGKAKVIYGAEYFKHEEIFPFPITIVLGHLLGFESGLLEAC